MGPPGVSWLPDSGHLFAAPVFTFLGFCACLACTRNVQLYSSETRQAIVRPTMANWVNAADCVFTCVFMLVVSVLCLVGTYNLWSLHSVEARWEMTDPSIEWFLSLYVARKVLHLPILFITSLDNKGMLAMMIAHHTLSAACYGYGLATSRMHFWGGLDGCCEVTSIALNLLYSLQVFGPDDSIKMSMAFAGMTTWLTFIVFRLMLFPFWLWQFWSDISNYPEKTWERVTTVERYMYPGVTVLLLILSITWFVPMTARILEGLGLKSTKKDQ